VPSIVIVTGSPGAGKTTLSAELARTSPRGVHLEGDRFFQFVAHPIPPTLPESSEQNATVIRATMRAAAAFATGGYEVIVDGIFGPWFLPVIATELEIPHVRVDYVILDIDLAHALRRAGTRVEPGPPAVVRQMHEEFAKPHDYSEHVFRVSTRGTEDLAVELRRRLAAGDFRLELGWARGS
jgi:tRNA uridine 5-carbamoylmethylation protein Kti12